MEGTSIHARHLPVLAAVALLAACTTADRAASAPRRTSVGFRLHYDLALHPERAELRQGRSLAIAPGTRAGSKYTLGGWRTGFTTADAGSSAGILEAGSGSLLVPVESDGTASLAIRCRIRSGSWLVLYIDGVKVHGTRVRAGELATHAFGAWLARGEHVLSFRAAGAIEVEWLRVAPQAGAHPADAPPDPSSLTSVLASGSRLLSIPAGWTLGYGLEVPQGARLRATVTGSRRQLARIVAFRDGSRPVTLGTFAASATGTPVDVDLGALAGRVVRLDLQGGALGVSLVDPRVVIPGNTPRRAHTHPRNVILFLVDTMRADRLRAYNPATRVRTPALDAFVSRAAVFERSYTQANWTKPSVATLLGSLFPWQHGALTRTDVLPGSIPMLQEHLQDHGYYTAGFVTNSFISDRFGFERGWDEWVHSRDRGRARAELVASDILGWLDERPAFQPFFIYVHTTDPHSPYAPPQDLLELYDADPYDGPVSFGRDPQLIDAIRRRGLRLDERDRRRFQALYDGEVTYHDEHFGRIIEGLAERGLGADTLVIFVSDHGEEFFDHGSVGHGQSAWQEIMHVPIIVRWPGVTGGPTRIGDPVGLVDVAPTILDILDLAVPGWMRGRSLLPLLLGEPATAPTRALCSIKGNWRCVVAGRYKLLEHATSRHATTPMLFDLEADPDELVDIASQRPLTLRYLRGLLGLAIHEAGPSHPLLDVEKAVIDTETAAHLEALGYLDTSRP